MQADPRKKWLFKKKKKYTFKFKARKKKGYLPKRKSKMQTQNCTFLKNKNNHLKKNIGTFILKKEWLDKNRREHFSLIEHRQWMDISKKGRLFVAIVAELKVFFLQKQKTEFLKMKVRFFIS